MSEVKTSSHEPHPGSIAIIGLAGQFPKASNVSQFWQNIIDGRECVTDFSEEELLNAGVSESELHNPHYVRRRAILEDIDKFDANFFNISPNDAALIDPQHRIFLECASQALDDASISSGNQGHAIGVFASCGRNYYFHDNLQSQEGTVTDSNRYKVEIHNDKDFLSTFVSYKLGLTGPSININTACSSSIVAVHYACMSLNMGECDAALVGAVSIELPSIRGYKFTEGMILSKDGYCRPFDDNASGTVPGSGCGVVVLKRVEDAVRDGDNIYCVIRGSAVNNDGSLKVSYAAPSVQGQIDAARDACMNANVSPATISYIEAHGTGTFLGDTVEFEALKSVYSDGCGSGEECSLGSVKANVGHLDAASGITSLIKVAKMLEMGMIPPSINFETPNASTDFSDTRFVISNKVADWSESLKFRRAAVNCVGIGGTNSHIILEGIPRKRPPKDIYTRPGSDRRSYWIGAKPGVPSRVFEDDNDIEISSCFWRSVEQCNSRPGELLNRGVLVFLSSRIGQAAVFKEIEKQYANVVVVQKGVEYRCQSNPIKFQLDPQNEGHCKEFWRDLACLELVIDDFIYFWTVQNQTACEEEQLESCLLDPVAICRHMPEQGNPTSPTRFAFVTDQMSCLSGEEADVNPNQALLLGLVKSLSFEFPGISACAIDADFRQVKWGKMIASGILREMSVDLFDFDLVAHRAGRRWTQSFEPIHDEPGKKIGSAVRPQGVYLITGGLGGIGFSLARSMAEEARVHLILISRTRLPKEEYWHEWLMLDGFDLEVVDRIKRIRELRALGAIVTVLFLDVSLPSEMRRLSEYLERNIAELSGIVHAAGVPGQRLIRNSTREDILNTLQAKVLGTILLDKLVSERGETLDFFVLCSSVTSLKGGKGEVAYGAANAFLDAHAQFSGGFPHRQHIQSINWPAWSSTGMRRTMVKAADTAAVLPKVENVAGGVFQTVISLLLADRKYVSYVGMIDLNSYWPLREHSLNGKHVMPASAYIDLISKYCAEGLGSVSAIQLDGVTFLKPYFHDQNQSFQLKVNYTGSSFVFRFESVLRGELTLHAKGKGSVCDLDERLRKGKWVPPKGAVRVAPASRAENLQSSELTLGARWKSISKTIWDGHKDKFLEAELRADYAGDLDTHNYHPALLDVAVYGLSEIGQSGVPLLPFRIRTITLDKALPRSIRSHMVNQYRNREAKDEYDIFITDGFDRLLGSFKGVSLREVQVSPAPKDEGNKASSRNRRRSLRVKEAESSISPNEGVQAFKAIVQSGVRQALVRRSRISCARPTSYDGQTMARSSTESARHLVQRHQHGEVNLNSEIARIVGSVIGNANVEFDDNFFDLGGDSLSSIEVVDAISESFNVQLEAAALFEASTVRELAERVRIAIRNEVVFPKKTSDTSTASRKVGLISYPSRSTRAMHLVCFHHAGGGTGAYKDWSALLPPCVEVTVVQLPGREALFNAPPFSRIQPLVDCVIEQIVNVVEQGPFALFGHSMGGLVAFEVCRRLEMDFDLIAHSLNVAAIVSPRNYSTYGKPNMTDDELRELISRYQPERGLNSDLINAMLPTIRADFELCENYEYLEGQKLNCPINVSFGMKDDLHAKNLADWIRETIGRVSQFAFEGGHFFLHEESKFEFLQNLGTDLTQHISRGSDQ